MELRRKYFRNYAPKSVSMNKEQRLRQGSLMDERKILGALGFAMKAGKCLSGDFICEKSVKDGRAELIILDEETSESTRERYCSMCSQAKIPLLQLKEVGAAIGKENRKIVAVTDGGFARMILEAHKC